MIQATLELSNLTVAHPGNTLYAAASMAFPRRGLTCVMGPSGSGKSTLLRVIAGFEHSYPTLRVDGDIRLGDVSLRNLPPREVQRQVALMPQKARLYDGTVRQNMSHLGDDATLRATLDFAGLGTELAEHLDTPVMELPMERHRMIVLARQLTPDTRYLLLDEPMRDVSLQGEQRLGAWFKRLAASFGVVMVTHSKDEVRAFADRVMLLTNRGLAFDGPPAAFFAADVETTAARFIANGSAWNPGDTTPSPDTESAPTEAAPPAATDAEATLPYEFHWSIPARLGGCQRPGLIGTVASDLRGLERIGVKHLITLTQRPLDEAAVRGSAIDVVHFPIRDMESPEIAATIALCERLRRHTDAGDAVVFHCRAGLGRTGTMIASFLVLGGESAACAIERIRTINPGYIQSDGQLRFVYELETQITQPHENKEQTRQDAVTPPQGMPRIH